MTVPPISPFKQRFLRACYKSIAKPILFAQDPEFVHTFHVQFGELLGKSSGGRAFTRTIFSAQHQNLGKTLDGIFFPNPVGLAAGFDYNASLPHILPELGFGFAVLGTVTLKKYDGNKKPRLGRYPNSQSLLVNKGFKSIGAPAIIKKLTNLSFKIPVGISIGSTNQVYPHKVAQITDIVASFKLFENADLSHDFYELNISCPNLKGGQPFTTPALLDDLLTALTIVPISRPVYIKMPIDLLADQTLALLKSAQKTFISGVNFGNLTKDRTNPDITERDRKDWQNVTGNLSGKPTWNRSNAHIVLTRKVFKNRFTIIGTGGIFSPSDAQAKLNLGADLVQLITGMIYEGPQLIGEILAGLSPSER
ncbi:MAG: hypothetical protein WAU07_02745 [Microgenomates group bacterium]